MDVNEDDEQDDDSGDESDDDCEAESDTAVPIITEGVLVGDGVEDVSGVDHILCVSEGGKLRQLTLWVLYASGLMTSVIMNLPGKTRGKRLLPIRYFNFAESILENQSTQCFPLLLFSFSVPLSL